MDSKNTQNTQNFPDGNESPEFSSSGSATQSSAVHQRSTGDGDVQPPFAQAQPAEAGLGQPSTSQGITGSLPVGAVLSFDADGQLVGSHVAFARLPNAPCKKRPQPANDIRPAAAVRCLDFGIDEEEYQVQRALFQQFQSVDEFALATLR